MTMNEISWQYIAGFLDGEGCIGFYPDGRTARVLVEICQAEPQEQVLFEIQAFCAEHGIMLTHRVSQSYGNRTPLHKIYTVNRAVASEFLKQIEPYLRVKRLKAKEMIAWADAHPARRGSRPRPIKKAKVLKILQLREEGMNLNRISYQVGLNRSHVEGIVQRNLTIPV